MNDISAPPALHDRVAGLAQQTLAPLVIDIDRNGLYPKAFLRELGALGGFSAALAAEDGGSGLASQIGVIDTVGRVCGSTAFLVWCQTTCIWYLRHAPNAAVRERHLGPLLRGERLGGTGLSNAMKHLAGIEDIRLRARRDGSGYRIDGSLPWVSNIGSGHVFAAAAAVDDGGYVMFLLQCDQAGVSLHACPEFAGLEGTRTLNVRLHDVAIDADAVIAAPAEFAGYIRRIKPGFVLGQLGIGFGIVDACLRILRESAVSHGHVNTFLDQQEAPLAAELAAARAQAAALADAADQGTVRPLDVLKLRAAAAELALRAANAAVLHAGAKGYLIRHPAQRRLREAVFVAIVTPALKQLRKEIHALEHAA